MASEPATSSDIAELTQEVRSLGGVMSSVLAAVAERSRKQGERQGGNANISVNAGGVGVAVAVGCAAFALACLMFAMLLQFDMGRKIERAQDYQNMLWQRYPELRPENLKPKEEKK